LPMFSRVERFDSILSRLQALGRRLIDSRTDYLVLPPHLVDPGGLLSSTSEIGPEVLAEGASGEIRSRKLTMLIRVVLGWV